MTTQSWQPYAAGDGNYNTMHTWAGNGDPARTFNLNFTGGYISQADVKAYMVQKGTTNTIPLTVTFVTTSSVTLSRAVPTGWDVTIYRDTPKDKPTTSFVDGALITAGNLERNAKQAIFAVAEVADQMQVAQAQVLDAAEVAEGAVGSVQEAKDIANSAVQTANDAMTQAKSAVGKANDANARVGMASGLAQDALDLAGQAIEKANSAIGDSQNVSRVIRAPSGETLSELPAKELRKGKSLSFDVNGDVVAVTPVSGSAEAVLQSLREQNGLSHIGLAHGTAGLDAAIKYISFEMFGAVSGNTIDQAPAIQAAVDAAIAAGLPIWSTGSYYMATSVNITSDLQITGAKFRGPSNTTSQRFNCSADITFDWCQFDKVSLYHAGGNLLIQNFQIANTRSTAALFSEKTPVPCTVELKYGTFRNCYFGYLRQGGSGVGLRTNIMRGLQFYDMQGDCIEMNLCFQDEYTLVEDIVVDVVDHLGTQPNWGIALGFAGKGEYGITDDYTNFFKNLTLRNVRVYAARQCIHIEKGYNCLIENVELYPDNTRSSNAGIETAGIVLYGCSDVTVKGVRGRPLNGLRQVWVTWGITSGQYKAAGRNITLEDIDVGGTVEVNMSDNDNFAGFLNIDKLKADKLSIIGHSADFRVSNVNAPEIEIEVHRVNNDGRDSVRRVRRTVATFDNIKAGIFPSGQVNIGRMAVDDMSVNNVNFPLRKTASSVTNRGTPVTKINGTYFHEGNNFPWGYWFLPGDRIVNNTGTVYTILTEGAQFKSQGDTTVRSATAGSTLLMGMGAENWTTVYWKTAGLKIVIPKAGPGGADLHTTIVQSAYISGGVYTFRIADPIVTAINEGTVIVPESICTFTTK